MIEDLIFAPEVDCRVHATYVLTLYSDIALGIMIRH